MKAKLITDGNKNYSLLDSNNELLGTTMESMLTNQKLSLKNCEAIKNGYDINTITSEMRSEFISKYGDKSMPLAKGGYWSRGLDYQCGVINGFQKALELMGDKKFSEYDMIKVMKEYASTWKNENEIIQSLQQTEWDVEIVCLHTGDPNHTTNTGLPKLDADGCLILRNIQK